MSKEEREERDYEHLPKKRRISLDGATPRRGIESVMQEKDGKWVHKLQPKSVFQIYF